MKVVFVPAKADAKIERISQRAKNRGKLGLVTTLQYLHQLKDLKKLLPGSVYGGQVLGCNVENAKRIMKKVDAFLYIGTGIFHPLQVALETDKDVYIADPVTAQITKLEKKEVEKRRRRIKGAFMKFLEAQKVGIITSTKPGQNMLNKAKKIAKQLAKDTYIFIADTVDFHELENYPEIEVWINTACPKIAIEDAPKIHRPILNISDVERFLNGEE